MSKTANSQKAFQTLTGDFSDRINANGGYKMIGKSPEMYAPVLSQYNEMMVRIKEIRGKQEHSKELSMLLRDTGNIKNLLIEGAQYAFERFFIRVAQYRMQKEHFSLISKEARELWRLDGFGECPIDYKKVRKANRRQGRNVHSKESI